MSCRMHSCMSHLDLMAHIMGQEIHFLKWGNPYRPIIEKGPIDRGSDRPIIGKGTIDRGSDRPIIEKGPIDRMSDKSNFYAF